MADKKVRKYAEGERTAADIAGRRSVRVTPKAMPKATVVTPKAMPTPKTTTLVRPKPKPSPRQEPVDETDYFRGQIRRNLRNNPLPKIGNDLVKFKKGGKIRGYGIARGGKPCKMR